MKKSIFILLVFLAFSCKNKTDKDSNPIMDTEVFQSVLDSIYTQNKNAIGLLVHVESPENNISWSGAAGFSNKENSKLDIHQPVLIASNTKTYVSAAILKLIEQSQLDLNKSIDSLIFEETNELLKSDGYKTSEITVAQLLNHTSGIYDYAGTEAYMQMVKKDSKHRYSRKEQIFMATEMGNPLGEPGDVFAYADTNYLLLTEIIENITKKPFQESLKTLINYDKLGMNATWFSTLEEVPENVLPLASQYWTSEGFDSYEIDHSFDLFGGGGIASTSKDLAVFMQSLFNHKIVNEETLKLIFTKANPNEAMLSDYYLGLSSINIDGLKGYGHGGFWGTAVNYFPDFNSSIAVFVLERDKRMLRVDINKGFLNALKNYNNLNQ